MLEKIIDVQFGIFLTEIIKDSDIAFDLKTLTLLSTTSLSFSWDHIPTLSMCNIKLNETFQ